MSRVFMRIRVTAILATTILLLGGVAQTYAATIIDDFNYGADDERLKTIDPAGGTGYGSLWGATSGVATSNFKVDRDTDLTYSGGGYNITQEGTGLAYWVASTSLRGINRSIDTNLSGTVWFSFLAEDEYGSSSSLAGVQLNSHADYPSYTGNDYDTRNFDVGIRRNALYLYRAEGSGYVYGTSTLAAQSPHLILGRLDFNYDGNNERVQLWADPADLQNLGTAEIDFSSYDIGDNLYMLGIMTQQAVVDNAAIAGRLDALRFSDDADAFEDVTGVAVPEPSTLMLLGMGLIGLLISAWRRS